MRTPYVRVLVSKYVGLLARTSRASSSPTGTVPTLPVSAVSLFPISPLLRQVDQLRDACYAALVAVDDPDTIDIMSIDPSGAVVLTIADYFDWTNSTSHQYILQAKMNRYLAFIEFGEIQQLHPDADERGVVIEVVARCEPDAEGLTFLRADTSDGASPKHAMSSTTPVTNLISTLAMPLIVPREY